VSYPDSSSRSARLFERAQHVLPGGNTRHTVAFEPYPIYAASARGCIVTDVDGVERIDFVNNYSSLVPVQRQAARLMAVGLPTESEIALAELLCERLPSVEQLRFCNSGSEAVMFAIRAARTYTGKPKIARVEGAYHGAYDHDQVGLPFNDVETTRSILDANKDALAGVLVDGIVGRMAFLEATPAYMAFLRDWTRANRRLLLMDEVLSFRIAYNGVQGRYGIEPDLTMLAKIIGGGLPVGAFGGKREIMSVFDHRNGAPQAAHAGTYNGNPLTMTAGRVSMELLTREEIDRINRLGDRLRDGMTRSLREARVPGRCAGAGSMVSVVFDDAPFSEYRTFSAVAARSLPVAHNVYRRLLDRGVLCVPYGSFFVSTAMDEGAIDKAIAAFADSLAGFPVPA
jgi:glutamate-1-semialdehyde 2,1-aminomutase